MNRLKFLREEKGLFQSDIAKILGVSIAAVGFYENEKRDMSPDTIIKLAEYFNVSTDYLLGKSDIRNIEDDFKFAYHKETEGLSEDEIKEALEFYKKIKYGKENKKEK